MKTTHLRHKQVASQFEASMQLALLELAAPMGDNFRSPILDMPKVEWSDKDYESHDTLWVMENLDSIPMFVLPYANMWMYSKVFGQVAKTPPTKYDGSLTKKLELDSGKAYANHVKTLLNSKESVRVKQVKGGFEVSLRVGSLDFAATLRDTFAQKVTLGETIVGYAMRNSDTVQFKDYVDGERQKNIHRVFDLFGPDFAEPHRAVDIEVPVSEMMQDTVVFNSKEFASAWRDAFSDDPDDSTTSELTAGIRSMRIIATPTRGAKNVQFYQSVSVAQRQALSIPDEMLQITSWQAAVALEKMGIAGTEARWLEGVLDGRAFLVYATVFFDYERVKVMCQQPDVSKIDAYDVNEWMQQWLHYTDSGDSSWNMSRLEDIRANNTSIQSRGLKAKQRTDANGFTVHPDGMLLWIPEGYDQVVEHKETSIATNTDAATGEFTLRNDRYANLAVHSEKLTSLQESVPTNYSQENRLLYIDWYNNKMAYTNTSGVQATLDLERCMPLTANHAYRLLQTPVGSFSAGKDAELICSLIRTVVKTWMQKGGGKPEQFIAAHPEWTQGFANSQRDMDSFTDFVNNGDIQEACVTVNGRMDSAATYKTNDSTTGRPLVELYPWIEDYVGDTFRFHLVSSASPIPAMRILGDMLKAATTWATENLQAFIGSQSILNSLHALGLCRIAVAAFGKLDSIRAADEKQREVYINSGTLDTTAPPTGFPLVSEDRSLQPHQVKCEALLDPSPQYSILKVQAGGGKTALILLDVLRSLKKGVVQRPLIMCPDHLVKDYVAEANFFTKGRLNIICVNGESLGNWGEDKLLKLVQGAPINTVVVSSYDFMKSRLETVMYGREEQYISLNCELLRLMGRDGAWLDESHMLRNVNQRSISVQRLMAEIPFKRLCTGTFVVDQLTDVANQFALLDPTVFGSRERFLDKYAAQMQGAKVARWKPGAENDVNRVMSQFCTVVSAQRKEWAALLPPRKEKFHFVPLSAAQRGVYDTILADTLEEIKKDNPELYKKLTLGDEDNAAELEGLLGPYLQRLEQYLTSPVRDKAGSAVLKGDDAKSPKAAEIEKIIREHIANKCHGKIIIFTSYVASAETIYASLPPDLKAMCIHYTAAQKFACAEKFTRDPKMLIMVGVEQSMNTGLNLQIGSRLIRVESVWSPGILEQGESRINRPMLKGKDLRTNIWFDWVICNKTIDITKIGRLIGKLVSSVKFENPYEAKYENIPDVPLISMTLKSIKDNNDAETALTVHLASFDNMREAQEADYDDYRHNPKINRKFEALAPNEPLKGAALLREVPYVSGMELFGSEDLGVMTYMAYCRQDPDAEVDPKGLMIHTEWGDGEIIGMSKNRLRVRLTGGDTISVGKLAAFIITRKSVGTATIRDQMSKLNGLKQASPIELEGDAEQISPVDPDLFVKEEPVVTKRGGKAKPDVTDVEPKVKLAPKIDAKEPDAKKIKQIKIEKPVPDTKAKSVGEVELYLSVVNGLYCLSVDGDGPTSFSMLKPYGFKMWDKKYMYAEIHNAKQMEALVEQLINKFEIPESFADELNEASAMFTKGRSRLLNPELADKSEFRIFYQQKMKACAENEVRPYVLIQVDDGVATLYVMIDVDRCPAAAKVRTRIRVPGVAWDTEDNWVAYYSQSKDDVKETVKAMQADGITVLNVDDVKTQFRTLRGVRK